MIAELPEGHKLLKDPSELAELTDAEDGKEFHEWSKDIGNQFAWGEKMPSDLRGLWLKVLYQFNDVFSANPKAPPPIKGVEMALYFKSSNPTPFYGPPPKATPEEKLHGGGSRDDAKEWDHLFR